MERLIGYDDCGCFEAVLGEAGRTVNDEAISQLIEEKTAIYGRVIAIRDVIYPGAAEFVRHAPNGFR